MNENDDDDDEEEDDGEINDPLDFLKTPGKKTAKNGLDLSKMKRLTQ